MFIVSVDRSVYANDKICWFWKEKKFLNLSEFGTLSCMLFERIGRPENVGTEGAGISETLYVLFHVLFNVIFVMDAWGFLAQNPFFFGNRPNFLSPSWLDSKKTTFLCWPRCTAGLGAAAGAHFWPENLHFFTLRLYNPHFFGSDGPDSMGS